MSSRLHDAYRLYSVELTSIIICPPYTEKRPRGSDIHTRYRTFLRSQRLLEGALVRRSVLVERPELPFTSGAVCLQR